MKFLHFSILSLALCGWCPLGSAQAIDRITPLEPHQNAELTEATLLKQTGLLGAKEKPSAAMLRNATVNAAFAYPISRYYLSSERSSRFLQSITSADSLPEVGDDILNPYRDFKPNENDPIFGTSVSMSDDGKAIAIVGSVIVDEEEDHYRSFVDVRDVNTGELIGDRVYTEKNEHPAIMQVLLSGNGMILAVAAMHPPSETFSTLQSGVQVYSLETTVSDNGVMTTVWETMSNFIPAGIAGDVPGKGIDISISTKGRSIVVGSRNYDGGKGKVVLFEISNDRTNWIEKFSSTGSNEQFKGTSVAIDKDGDCIALGSTGYDDVYNHRKGSVAVYAKDGTQIGNTIVGEGEDDECGFSVSLGKTSESVFRVAVGAVLNDPTKDLIDAGHVRIFEINVETETEWRQVGTDIDGKKGLTINFEEDLFHVGDYFGFSLDMSHDGKRVAVGAPFYSDSRESGYYSGRAAVYVFPEEDTSGTADWEQFGDAIIGSDKSSSSGFSIAIARGGTNLIVGTGGNSEGGDTGNVSIYLETQVSESPSAFPSLSSQPSMAPSAYSFRTFSIISSYSKFASLDTSQREWCLKTQTITPDSPLKIRPCETEVHKGKWYYEDKKIKLRRDIEMPDEFCIKDEGRKLFLKNCQNVIGSEFFFGEDDSTISVVKNGKKLYFGIDTLKIFSRVRLFSAGNRNSSYNSWTVRHEGPSNAPSESAV